MLPKPVTIVLFQNQPQQQFHLSKPVSDVCGISITNLHLTGMTTVGKSIFLSSFDFASNDADGQSQMGTPAGDTYALPIGWIQPFPLPDLADQVVLPTLVLDTNRTIRALNLSLQSDGVPTFTNLSAGWVVTLYRCAC